MAEVLKGTRMLCEGALLKWVPCYAELALFDAVPGKPMKLCLFLFTCGLAFAAEWDAVQRIPTAQKLEVSERSGGGRFRATLVSAGPETIVVREASGERSIPRADIRELRVFDSARKVRRGLLWTLVGAGAGLIACLSCRNEGGDVTIHVPLGVAVGAGIGSLGFLSSSYRRFYKSR